MSTVSQEDTKSHVVESLTTTITVSKELWKRVKIAAAEHETSAQQICSDGLELALRVLAEKGKNA
jgi:hypothetical protein